MSDTASLSPQASGPSFKAAFLGFVSSVTLMTTAMVLLSAASA